MSRKHDINKLKEEIRKNEKELAEKYENYEPKYPWEMNNTLYGVSFKTVDGDREIHEFYYIENAAKFAMDIGYNNKSELRVSWDYTPER